jgi:uncharacterized protein
MLSSRSRRRVPTTIRCSDYQRCSVSRVTIGHGPPHSVKRVVSLKRPGERGQLVQRYVVFYESADDVMSKAAPVYPRHLARLKQFRDRGDLLLVGTFGDPQAEGSMAIFRSRQAAEEFVRDDPFVNEGVVKAWTLREWDEVASEI